MDKLVIKQGSFIQQTQYFIPVEFDLSVVPARLGISALTYFSTCAFGQLTKKSICPTQSFSCPKKLIKITTRGSQEPV